MTKTLALFGAVFLLLGSFTIAHAQPSVTPAGVSPEVPTDHWAYSLVDRLKNVRLRLSYGGLSKDLRPVWTRRDFAVFTAGLLADAGTTVKPFPWADRSLSLSRLEVLRYVLRMVQAFEPELQSLGVDVLKARNQLTLFIESEAALPPKKVYTRFRDIPLRHWAEWPVEVLRQAGIVLGYPDATFQGNR